MADSQVKKILSIIESNIRGRLRSRGMSVLELVTSIEMSEPGFYKMLQNESMKIKTLINIAEVLDERFLVLFDGVDDLPYSNMPSVLAEPESFYSTERDLLMQQIDILKGTIEDKNRIIKLLTDHG